LTFNGNCREAMSFYKRCLGGKLLFQTVSESPLAEKLPKKMKDFILHATLTRGEMVLMGTDMVSETGLIKGNSVSIALHCQGEEEIRTCYEKLSAGGQASHPLNTTFWGSLFGDLIDKYGNHWLLHLDRTDNT
jgi:PhnB protein